MDLQYSESERLIKERARAFLQRELPPERVGLVEAAGELPRDLWTKLGQQGWLGIGVDEAAGGSGGTLVEWAIVLEEMGYGCCPAPVPEQLAVGAYLAALGTAGSGALTLADVASGSATLSIGVESPAAEPAVLRDGRLAGRKTLVPYGASVDWHVLFAGPRQAEQYVLVARGKDGVTLRSLKTLSGDQHVEARFDSVVVELLGAASSAPWEDLRAIYTIARDAFAVGLMQRMLDMTVSYVKDRVQFGRPIGSFQAIQYRCVDIALAAYGAQAMLYQGAWSLQHRRPAPLELGLLHSYTRDACEVVVRNAHQSHGAIGFTQEYPLHYFSRRAKAHQQAVGVASEHREVAAAAMAAAV